MKFNQRIDKAIIPDDSTWGDASTADRLAYFKQAGTRAVAIKRAELERAIGANGRRMAPRKRPRPDGASGPVLTPHDASSRTSRLMASHADIQGITIFWRAGVSNVQRLPWGTILGFHSRGEVKGAPVRDVRLSKAGIGKLKQEMVRWWLAHHAPRLLRQRADRIAAEEAEARERARKKKPGIAAKAKKAIEKKYRGLAAYFNPRGGGF